MKKVLGIAAVVAAQFLASAAFAGDVSVHGSTTFSAAIMDANKAAIEKDAGVKLNVVGNGSGNGLSDLAAGKAEIAMLSAKVEDVAAKLNAKLPGSVDFSTIKQFEIGKTSVAFAVNPANPVKELTQAQVADILKGTTTNWKQVGGEDKNILVVTEVTGGGMRTEVEKALLGGSAIAGNKREMVNGSMISKIVAQLPEAMGIMPSGAVSSSVRALKLDKEESIELYMATKGSPSGDAQKVIDAAKKYAAGK